MMKQLIFLVLLISSLFAKDSVFKEAQERALEIYEYDNLDIYRAQWYFEHPIIKEFLTSKPSQLKQNEYEQLLYDYGSYLARGEPSKKHCDAKIVLERVIKLDPKHAAAHLKLADLYLQIKVADEWAAVNWGGATHPIYDPDTPCSDKITLAQIKQMYIAYVKLMKETNQTEKIPKRVETILLNDRLYTSSDPFHSLSRSESITENEELCDAYVEALNRLPEATRILECEHDISTLTTEFQPVAYEELSRELKKRDRTPTCGRYRYKNKVFVDTRYGLYAKWRETSTDVELFCKYQLLDFTEK